MFWLLALLILLWGLLYYRSSLRWTALATGLLLGGYLLVNGATAFSEILLIFFALVFIPLNIPFIRRQLLSRPLSKLMKAALPVMSQTEQEALEAGNTWWEAELFSGRPDWKILQDLPAAQLTEEEQAFIDGPVERLCEMLNDWDITHNRKDLPKEVWDYIKQQKFCGMIIPKRYGGLDFSDTAHSEIVMKISSRSSTAAVTVMVPNSLGPAKLLLAYGTEQQKNYYLPRLASGEEIPAFALTGPQAGSDASAMPDTGIVCYGAFEGQDNVLGIRLNWEKRYITLGPVATVLGLAFKLYDPDGLIGGKKNIGITVALIPTNTPGVSIGRRHFPLDSAFQNGPNWGKDVFIPMDWIIGGVAQAGNGWKMLMQSLATGRAISLPALSVGAAKFTCRNTGAYARVRKQFKLPIGELEGIEEPLSRMAGETYILDAARKVTTAALDNGEKPAVISAILKYELTERMRRIVNDGMDIQGGAGICLGPKNYLGRLYQVIPVSITVEGANILTRTMMIFGQGAIRCHPYLQKEMAALQQNNLPEFDNLLFQHLGFFMHNMAASLWLGLTNARFHSVPGDKDTQRYYRQIARLSVNFALLADFALLTLGGTLKRKERISGRFADALSNLYLCSCVLKHYQDQGCPKDDSPLLHWACRQTIYRAQQSVRAIFWKLPLRPLIWLLRIIIFPTGKPYSPPGDRLIHETASLLLADAPVRERLTHGIYINNKAGDATGRIEVAFKAVLAAAPMETKIRLAQKQKLLAKADQSATIADALAQNIITQQEADLIEAAERARLAAITVDDFSPEELAGNRQQAS
ncbi:acyl coenzyme A dehydrogenase [Candidatus Methylobacter favarea]|uniref:Acyl-coenzyme A dehydrogenase n=1 Tax=Candidatus Methylobacter favarea TaxID=2707345 RepID=A0A8S0WJX7_9GAMM|nr:acyl-CoA dehydrogenase [Candidatus Methylobacter favarea]CAA9891588.1 acyl coenzyme A dehydrogenase [Candidatus Methylobacter favarea]